MTEPENKPESVDIDSSIPTEAQDQNSAGNGEQDVAETLNLDPVVALEQEVAKWKDVAARTAAEHDNFRKRNQREREEYARYANQRLLEELLPILDNFDMGLQAASSDPGSMIYIGMQMVKRQLDEFLSNQKVVEIPADGLAFDHNVHEAIGTEVRPDLAEGTIVAVKRKGYKIAERLLRPATVVVSCLQEQGPA